MTYNLCKKEVFEIFEILPEENMKRWEYLVVRESDPDSLEEGLNRLGEEGWEVVSASFEGVRHVAYLKREKIGAKVGVPERNV